MIYYSLTPNHWGTCETDMPKDATEKTEEEYNKWYLDNIINRPPVKKKVLKGVKVND
jgi:hypothetical protein